MMVKTMECDLVVLGAGGSGLVAGCRAFDLTGKKVVILEKAPKPSGCTYFASRMGESGPIKDSKWQKDAGYEVNEEIQDLSGQFFDWLVTATKGDAEKFFWVSTDGEMKGSMCGEGGICIADRTEKYKDLPDHSIGPGRMGSWMVDHLSAYCRKVGIDLLTSTRARKFITDDKGKVTAVLADTGDGQLLVNCKACVIAAGGYGANKDLLRKYYPENFTEGKFHSLCPPYITGDCILAAEEIGARIDPTIRSLNFPGGFFGDGMSRHPWNTNLQNVMSGKAVVINLDGKRWKNEGGMMGGGENDGYIGDQRNGVGIAIVDSDIVKETEARQSGMQMGGSDPRTITEDLESEAAMDDAGASGGHTKKADSLVELALKMKVDPRALMDTIERYNGFCETGKDLDFGKSAQNLQKIQTPPFYAIYGHRWTQSTKGRNGICVNSEFQVLNDSGETLPGMWAAGDGCTIFGGFVIGSQTHGVWNEEETAARTKLSKSLASAAAVASGKGGQNDGGPGGMGMGGPGEGGQGAMMMMGGGGEVNILEGKSSPCGGLGPAFLSGFCAGTFAAKYLEEL